MAISVCKLLTMTSGFGLPYFQTKPFDGNEGNKHIYIYIYILMDMDLKIAYIVFLWILYIWFNGINI